MSLCISLPLQEGAPIFLQGGATGTSADLSGLCRLLNLETDVSGTGGLIPAVTVALSEPPPPGPDEYSFHLRLPVQVIYSRRSKTFRMYLLDDTPKDHVPTMGNVLQCAVGWGIMSCLLRGKLVTLVHCSLLETKQGGLMICGESGMGKSTTARRFCEAGGICHGDDMILLEVTPDGFYGHPLPTWSACQTSLTDHVYPFNCVSRLTGVLGLSRDDDMEEIREIPQHDFFAQLYRSLYYFQMVFVRYLQPEEQREITARLQEIAGALSAAFPAKGLFANLSFDLRKTLENYL